MAHNTRVEPVTFDPLFNLVEGRSGVVDYLLAEKPGKGPLIVLSKKCTNLDHFAMP